MSGSTIVEVACIARPRGFAARPCSLCGGPSTIVVRLGRRVPGAEGVTHRRRFFCEVHRTDAILAEADLVAQTAAARPEGDAVRASAAVPFPFDFPSALAAAVDAVASDRLVGVYWHGAADVLAVYGSRHSFITGPAARRWWALVESRAVSTWLREQMILLGSPGGAASHHLLFDRRNRSAVAARAIDARRLVASRFGLGFGVR